MIDRPVGQHGISGATHRGHSPAPSGPAAVKIYKRRHKPHHREETAMLEDGFTLNHSEIDLVADVTPANHNESDV